MSLQYISMELRSKINCLQKWYIRPLHLMYRSMFTRTEVNTMGARPFVSTDDLAAPLRQVLHSAYEWKRPLVMAAQDIQWAFDSMVHGLLMNSLLRRGLPAHMVANLMRELLGFQAQIRLPNTGVRPPFRFDRGGKQGGVETPDQFNTLLEAIMEPVVVSWRERCLGLKIDEDSEERIAHLTWADNIFILAENNGQLKTMTNAVYLHKLCWEPASLEVMAAGSLSGSNVTTSVQAADGQMIRYKQVREMMVLGNLLDAVGSTEASVDYRLELAEKSFCLNACALTGPGSVLQKMRACSRAHHAVSLFGSRTWHLSRRVLDKLKRWEYKFCGGVLGFA